MKLTMADVTPDDNYIVKVNGKEVDFCFEADDDILGAVGYAKCYLPNKEGKLWALPNGEMPTITYYGVVEIINNR